MARPRKDAQEPARKRRPATTPEEQENRQISLTMDLVERQLEEGTASAQVLTHFLKLATSKHKLEEKKLKLENDFLIAKVDALASAKVSEEMYGNAIAAMRRYQGADEEVIDEY